MRPGDVDAGLLTSSTWRSMWRRQAAAPGCAEVAGRHPRKRRAQSLLGPLAAQHHDLVAQKLHILCGVAAEQPGPC